jgi:hypothetical protein
LTKRYVRILFPPVPDGAYCHYWEFSDEPQFFARLWFSTNDGEMVEKHKHSVLQLPFGQSTVV